MGFTTDTGDENTYFRWGSIQNFFLCCKPLPVYFCSHDRLSTAPMVRAHFHICSCTHTGDIQGAQILGSDDGVNFHFERSCIPCSNTKITVTEGKRHVGHASYNSRGCCSTQLCAREFVRESVSDAQGNDLYHLHERGCCCHVFPCGGQYVENSCCGLNEYAWPISKAGQPDQVLGHLSYRYHVLWKNYPSWMGFRSWPKTAKTLEGEEGTPTPAAVNASYGTSDTVESVADRDEQMLLLALALQHWTMLTYWKANPMVGATNIKPRMI